MTPDANKALIRDVFEKVIPAGDPAGLSALVAPDWIDHDPLPGQPAGLAGAELQRAGYGLLHAPRTEPWGQTVTRLLTGDGLIVGISYAPVLHDEPA